MENKETTASVVNESKIDELIERGKRKGVLTYKEIMDTLEDLELEPEQIERMYDRLAKAGRDTAVVSEKLTKLKNSQRKKHS